MRAIAAEQFGEQHALAQVVGTALFAGAVGIGDRVLGHAGDIGRGGARLDSDRSAAEGLVARESSMPEVVGHLVQHGAPDLRAQFCRGEAQLQVGAHEDHDAVGECPRVPVAPLQQRDTLVDAQDALVSGGPALGSASPPPPRGGCRRVEDPLRQVFEGLVDDPLELGAAHGVSLGAPCYTRRRGGRLAQRESAAFTRQRSLVQSQ